MSDDNKDGIKVVLVTGYNNYAIYFSSDYLWEVDDNGNLMIVKEYGQDWKIATFACGEWQYVKRENEENNL